MNSLHDHYYLTTAVQACTLVSAGDVFAQLIELRAAQKKEGASQLALADYDPTRTVRMGCLGLFIGGLGTAAWLRQLERALPMRDAHQYSAFSNLPVWAYAPVLRTVGIDQATLAECAIHPPPTHLPPRARPPLPLSLRARPSRHSSPTLCVAAPPSPCVATPPPLPLRAWPPLHAQPCALRPPACFTTPHPTPPHSRRCAAPTSWSSRRSLTRASGPPSPTG